MVRATLPIGREVVFHTNLDGRDTFLNPAWERLTGFGVDASLGTRALGLVPAAAPRAVHRDVRGADLRAARAMMKPSRSKAFETVEVKLALELE